MPEYEGNVSRSNEIAVTTPRNPFDCISERFSGSHPQSSFALGFSALNHANPRMPTVALMKYGLSGSSQEIEESRLPEPPITPRIGTMQQSEALADVRRVINTEAFILILKLYCC
jgi:hypothetical protein